MARKRAYATLDALSAPPAVDKRQIAPTKFRLAMSVRKNRHYQITEIMGRHFVQTGKAAGFSKSLMRDAITELYNRAPIGGLANSIHLSNSVENEYSPFDQTF